MRWQKRSSATEWSCRKSFQSDSLILCDMVILNAERCASGAADSRSDAGAEAIGGRLQAVVRCCAGVEERPMGSVTQEPCAYGQARIVMPLSCAYLAADASTRGHTSA
jgi:hypothetical protein